jgi:hypothetical protein
MVNRTSAAIAAAVLAAACLSLSAQTPQVFQFVVSATDTAGAPVSDLRAEDVVMSEDGVRQTIAKVEPVSIPIKVTIAIDNGNASQDAIADYRAGLTGLVDALPPDVEVTLIATAPQPRNVVKPTNDHAQILKGINSFAPEQAGPKFTDALVEYSERLQREAKDSKAPPYLPVMVMVSTASTERTSYQPKQIEQAGRFLVSRHAKVNLIMVSTRPGDAKTTAMLGSVLQAIVGKPVVQATNGRYEELGISSRLATLLPEWGRDLATLHARQSKQFRVTVERTRSGNLQNPKVELARPGLTGAVTLDGYLP